MKRDLSDDLQVLRAIDPVSVTDNTPFVSQKIDMQNFQALMFAVNIGAIASGAATFAALLEDSADNVTFATVDPAYTVGTVALAGFTFANPNSIRKIGYIGPNRYVRLTITPSGNVASAVVIGAVAILGSARHLPRSAQS